MLFLHTLLFFFLFGTSVLATPIPGLVNRIQAALGSVKPERMNGYWVSTTPINLASEITLPQIVIQIRYAQKNVEVLFPKEEEMVKNGLANIYAKTVTWRRILEAEEFEHAMGASLNTGKTIEKVEPKWKEDKLVIEYLNKQKTLNILLNNKYVIQGFMPFSYNLLRLCGYWRLPSHEGQGGVVYIHIEITELYVDLFDPTNVAYNKIFKGHESWRRVTSAEEYESSVRHEPSHEIGVDQTYMEDKLQMFVPESGAESSLTLKLSSPDQGTVYAMKTVLLSHIKRVAV